MQTPRVLILAALIGAAYAVAQPDSPLMPPQHYETCSSENKFCIVSDPREGTTVFHVSGDGTYSEEWSLPNWHRDLHVSNDGIVVIGYPGLNLLSIPDATPNSTILRFWRNGKEIREVPLSEIIRGKKLVRTVSHYSWGSTRGFNKDGDFEVATADDRVVMFDGSSGDLVGERPKAE